MRLIRPYTAYEPKAMSDRLALLAFNVEEALLMTDAVPGVEYTRLDVMRMAVALCGPWANDVELETPSSLDIEEYLGDRPPEGRGSPS